MRNCLKFSYKFVIIVEVYATHYLFLELLDKIIFHSAFRLVKK